MLRPWLVVILTAWTVGLGAISPSLQADDASTGPLLTPPTAEVVRGRTMEWVAQRGITDRGVLESIGKLWSFGDEVPQSEQLFEGTIQSFGLADAETRKFIDACYLPQAPLVPPEPKLLQRDGLGTFYTANMKLFYGKYLVHREMYEEALEMLETAPLNEVVDPAALLFTKAVCQHQLLMKGEGLKTLDQLLKQTVGVPARYSSVATLMQFDLQAASEKTLDEVSRKMSDVERRLKLGRAGEKVQKKEDEIVATLDELIKKLEDQSGGGGGGGGGDGKSNSNKSSSPAGDSSVKGATAPGETDKKKFSNEGGWGALPPKERTKASSDIQRFFGSHYLDVMDAFSKKQSQREERAKK